MANENRLPLYRRILQPIHSRAAQSWDGANLRTHNLPAHIWRAVSNFSDEGISEASSFAYWALFSLFPLVVIGILVIAQISGPRTAKTQVSFVLNEFLPGSISTLIRDDIDQVIAHRTSFSLLSLFGLLLGATRLFTELQRSLSRIFHDEQRRKWHIKIVTGVLMMLVLGLLIIVSLLLVGLLRYLNLELVGRRSPFLGIGAVSALLVTNTIMFTLLFRYVPQRNVAWRVLLPAALLSAIAFELSRTIFDWYLLHIANFGIVYGSVGAIIGLLTWMFVIGCLVSLCAEFAVAIDDWWLERVRVRARMSGAGAIVHEVEPLETVINH